MWKHLEEFCATQKQLLEIEDFLKHTACKVESAALKVSHQFQLARPFMLTLMVMM